MKWIRRIVSFIERRLLIKRLNRTFLLNKHTHLTLKGSYSFSKGVIISEGVTLSVPPQGRLEIGIGVFIGKDSELGAGKQLSIGDRTSIQVRSTLLGNITMGRGCVCAPNLYISSGIHHYQTTPELPIKIQDALARNAPENDAHTVTVGDDCWLGINVVVMRGITIGKGCVVGSNSVVTKSLPPYSIAVGAPAKVIKKRLEFVPPKTIVANNNRDYPYFYSGIQAFYDSEEDDQKLKRDQNGFLLDQHFILALDAKKGSKIHLTIWASNEGSIQFQGAQKNFVPGENTIQFDILNEVESHFFEFFIPHTSPHQISLIRAQVLDV